MIIEDNPVFDKVLRTISTTKIIDKNDDVVVSLNGMWAIYDNDITILDTRTIKISDLCEIDWEEDEIAVIYTTI